MTNNELLRAARRVGEEAGLIDLWSAEELLAVASYIEDAARSSQTSESDVVDTMIIQIRSFRRIKQLESKYRKIRNTPEDKNNNWLKMHGYPMRREIAGRHGRRKEHICRNHSGSCPEDNGLSKNKYQEPGRTPEIESEVHNCKGKDLPAQRAGADRSGNMPEVNRQPQLAVCNSGLRNQNIRRNQNGRRYSGGWPSRKR